MKQEFINWLTRPRLHWEPSRFDDVMLISVKAFLVAIPFIALVDWFNG